MPPPTDLARAAAPPPLAALAWASFAAGTTDLAVVGLLPSVAPDLGVSPSRGALMLLLGLGSTLGKVLGEAAVAPALTTAPGVAVSKVGLAGAAWLGTQALRFSLALEWLPVLSAGLAVAAWVLLARPRCGPGAAPAGPGARRWRGRP